MLKTILVMSFICIMPILVGSVLQNKKKLLHLNDVISIYVSGYFIMVALFQLICVPMCFLKVKFHILVISYTLILLLICIFSGYRMIRHGLRNDCKFECNIRNINKFQWFYFTFFLILLAIQLYYAMRYSITYMSYDDATYLTYANSAVQDDKMYLTHYITGNAKQLDFQRSLQSSILFISYMSYITGINVTTMAHTIMSVQLVIMAYGIYYIMAQSFFKKIDNRLIFMIILEVLYIFGYYSPYSMTFRLLGPIWQGKAILEVILTPYLFVYIADIFKNEYSRTHGIQLMMYSVASTAFSLGGTGTMMIIVFVIGVLLTLFVYKKWKNLIYLAWGSLAPVIYIFIYIGLRG